MPIPVSSNPEQGRNTNNCYGFAYPNWDPPAAPGEPPDKRGYRGGAGG